MTEVTEDMIGCLCKFWYHDERDYTIAELMDVACHRKFPSYKGNDCWYSHCQTVKPDEVKFYGLFLDDKLTEAYLKGLKEGQEKADKDYKITCLQCEKDELAQKIHKLEQENKELKERLADVSKTIDHIGDTNEKVGEEIK